MPKRAQPWARRPPIPNGNDNRNARLAVANHPAAQAPLVRVEDRRAERINIDFGSDFGSDWRIYTSNFDPVSVSSTTIRRFYTESGYVTYNDMAYLRLEEERRRAEQERLREEARQKQQQLFEMLMATNPDILRISTNELGVKRDSLDARMQDPIAVLTWVWHYSPGYLAGHMDLFSSFGTAANNLRKILFQMVLYGYVPTSEVSWHNNQNTVTGFVELLDRPLLVAKMRSFMRAANATFEQPNQIKSLYTVPQYINANTRPRMSMTTRDFFALLDLEGMRLDPARGPFLITGGNPMKVLFYQNDDKLIRDVPTTSTIGKSLPCLAISKPGHNAQFEALAENTRDRLVRLISDAHREIYSTDDVEFLTKPEDIIDVYQHSNTSSCMSKGNLDYQSPVHPVTMYGDCPGVALAVLRRGKQISARTIVYTPPDNPDDKRFIRIYGDMVLQTKLQSLGFKAGTLRGAQLKKIPATLLDGTIIPDTWTTVYIDDMVTGGEAAYIFTHEKIDYFVVGTSVDQQAFMRVHSEHNPRAYHSRGTNGLIGKHMTYHRDLDRKYSYLIRGIKYSEPNSSGFNQDHDIQCAFCAAIDHSDSETISDIGIFYVDRYVCHDCASVYFSRLADGELVQNSELAFLIGSQDNPVVCRPGQAAALGMKLLNTGQYRDKTRGHPIRLRNGDTRQSQYGVPMARVEDTVSFGETNVLKTDVVITMTGRQRTRWNVHEIQTIDGDPTISAYCSIGDLLDAMFDRTLMIKGGRLYIASSPAPSSHLLPEIEGDDDTSAVDELTAFAVRDVIAAIYAHVRTRNGKPMLQVPDTWLRQTRHQLSHILPHVFEGVRNELVSQWYATSADITFSGDPRGNALQQAIAALPCV